MDEMIRRLRIAFVATLVSMAFLLASPSAIGQSKDDRDLEELRQQIRGLEQRLASVRSRAKTTREELEGIEYELRVRNREVSMAQALRLRLEREHTEIALEIENLSARIEREKEDLRRTLTALHRLGPLSYVRVVLSSDTGGNPLESMALLSYLIRRDARAVAAFRTTRDLLAAERNALEEKQQRVRSIDELVRERQRAVQQSQREKVRVLERLQSDTRDSASRLASLREKAERLERLLELLYRDRDSATHGVARIEQFQGALGWPVQGEIIEGFGRQRSEKFATYTMSNGIKIAAPPGTEVRSVFEGTVLYAQWFKGYGNLVIIDHGERVFSLYGNTRSTSVRAGQQVEPHELIGRVMEAEEGERGHLYFEIRVNNEPVDPRRWLR